MTNTRRHVSCPSGLVWLSPNQTSAAISVPKPNPDCRKPAPFGRAWFGQVSASSATPVLHSLPIANPVIKRRKQKVQKSVANAVIPLKSA